MKILVINAGSSSLKYQVIDMENDKMLVKGNFERIGQAGSFLTHKVNGVKRRFEHEVRNHEEAIQFILSRILNRHYGVIKSLDELAGIGHRVVHGGEKFKTPVIITEEVIEEIEKCSDLAPLHNPNAIAGIRACQKVVPNMKMVAVFDTAIEYQTGRANIQSTCLNVLKGFMAVSLFTKVPVEMYKFCITLQTTFSGDLIGSFIGATRGDLGTTAEVVLKNMGGYSGLLGLLTMIALAYCVVKLFFANIKRGGILLCQIAVGSLYMFSLPRGFSDGFNGWCKQIFALCLTAFLQTSLMFLGLLTWQTNMLLGLGIMLAANEVPRIAQQFGLDTSVRVNMMSVTHTVNSAIHAGKFVARKLA